MEAEGPAGEYQGGKEGSRQRWGEEEPVIHFTSSLFILDNNFSANINVFYPLLRVGITILKKITIADQFVSKFRWDVYTREQPRQTHLGLTMAGVNDQPAVPQHLTE